MKKLLLTFAGALALAFSAAAAEPITTNFLDVDGFDDPGTTPVSKTIDGVDYTFMGSYVSAYFSKDEPTVKTDGYLFIKGKTTKGAYFTFTLPFDCSKVVVKTTSGCSTNAKSTVNFYAGETKLETGKALNLTSTEFTFIVPEANSAAGTVYKIESNTASYNQQIQTITYYPISDEPALEAEFADVAFAAALGGSQEQTIKLLAENLADDTEVTVTSDNDAFTVPATATIAEVVAGITVKYTGATAGTAAADITFKAAGLTATVSATGFTASHAGTETDPLTVSDVLGMNSANTGTFYVTGVIGDLTCGNAKDGMVTTVADATKNVKTNLVLKEGEKMIGMVLPNGEVREAFNIVDNPDNVGKTVLAEGTLGQYFGAPGIPTLVSIEFGKSDAIDSIVADENAPVEYFNLQGVRVANPTAGLYIRRQGATVTKVLVK